MAPLNSYRTGAYLDAARQLGLEVLVASEGDHSLTSPWAGGIHIDLTRPSALERLLDAAAVQPFAGVVATDDATVELASRVARHLSLPHNPPEAALFSRRKDLARDCLRDAGLPVPEHRQVDLRAPLSDQLAGLVYPCVIKPVALSGSRGVMRVESRDELVKAVVRLQSILDVEYPADAEERQQMLVERFIPGPEVAVEGLLREGELQVLAIFDKPDPMDGPFFEETYYISPSRHPADLQDQLVRRVAEACAAYGLREGPVHGELRWHDGDAWIMEVASRTIGGYCGRLLQFGTGHNLESLVLSRAVGEGLTVESPGGGAGVLMIPIPKAGVLRRVEGVLAAQQVEHVDEVLISLREGYRLTPLPEGSQYLGFIFARAADAATVERALREAHEKLNIVVAPLLALNSSGAATS